MTFTKTKLAKSVTMVLAGAALAAGASNASAHVMYNTFSTATTTTTIDPITNLPVTVTVANPSATDGWTRTYDPLGGTATTGPASQGNKGTLVPWVGTAAGALPFGYAGSSHLNWAAELHTVGQALTVSAADSFADYGVTAEIDTGAGAGVDAGAPASVSPVTGLPVAAAAPTGWRHQTDIGLIQSHVTQNVTINLSTLGTINNNFGVTVFTGMDTNTANYSHHGSWNCPTCATPKPLTNSNPFGTAGLTYLTHDATVDAVNGLTFTALAGQVYSIYFGGNGVGRWSQNVAGYEMNITTSAVPVPGAVWLFGSALAGLVGLRRRKAA
ncbi:MAG: VPLPA-CTERM sorting domain-containing protein [Methylococcales bacterium]